MKQKEMQMERRQSVKVYVFTRETDEEVESVWDPPSLRPLVLHWASMSWFADN